ncbi:MAG: hypothetical protein GF307_08500 [candidate division Zixibacteria bacterium]|nr:hypothetical protein [candidate division Zixibacteria bacterium]
MENYIVSEKTAILNRWFDLIVNTYPDDTARFLKNRGDKFANPVGYTVADNIEILFDEICNEMDFERLNTALDNLLRIRSVQNFTPSQAVDVVYLLKKAIHLEVLEKCVNGQMLQQLLEIENRIDATALMAFDVYVKCREKIFEIRLNEARRGMFKPFSRRQKEDI